jgi:hypothetical protein
MSTPQNAFSSIPTEEMSSVAGGVTTQQRQLFHLQRLISHLGDAQQQNQNQSTQTMLMAAVMGKLMQR